MTGVNMIWSVGNDAHTVSYNRWPLNAIMLMFKINPGGEETHWILVFVFQNLAWPTETHSALSFSVRAFGDLIATAINRSVL
jgi:hypothetical protein